MRLTVHVEAAPGPTGTRPPAGCPVRVELLDTSLADAPSTVVTATTTPATAQGAEVAVAVLEVDAADLAGRPRVGVRAHCDLAGDGRVTPGDWVTTQSYPVERSAAAEDLELTVLVRPVP